MAGPEPSAQAVPTSQSDQTDTDQDLQTRTASYETGSDTRPWLLRMGQTLGRFLPRGMQRHIDGLQQEHDRAVLEAAIRQMDVYQQIVTRSNVLQEQTLLNVQRQGYQSNMPHATADEERVHENGRARVRLQDRTVHD
ncbi:hypothetical protein MOBT1_002812 [Malassezia obtusa]|uniref:Uncharacterized protein n=1 Tax=Malassezia obtusa TaxID=76774 RepID=A0AAF0E443_9BASI|nr:hypothetical protein MOBT1_002812 [Malassezia obtusa]